eukprot:CAMPEP_0183712496 /NCGR_PEP_ID=MMETSP0737-20130205/7605_1 /TAXON_ID=385413 /ORGANISM="Thalassiosira miniscula, Strain CCMP1093" /LENGTH=721 /DNA_ID=CAMNT_0025941117 /DNA_START=201 /DNA_END=2366 /DNA_ORIENTATION=+
MILNQKSILVLLALCATIFSMGLIVGTRLFGAPNADAVNTNGNAGEHKNAEASPLVAATSKIASSDIQNLILESARAENIEKEQHRQEKEALAHGDSKLAAHLRGALAPGDENYNPHHAVDDVVGGYEEGGGGDGAMYAGDNGDNHAHEKGDSMHNHFLEALKHEWGEVKEKARNIVHHNKGGLRGGGDAGAGSSSNVGGGNASSSIHNYGETAGAIYPYMTSPVSQTYNFQNYEPLGGNRFIEYKDGDSPYAITAQLIAQSDDLARSRRYHVLGAMKHIWKNYKEYAFGMDELHPISKRGTSNWGGMGTTLVDALDTLWLMGMKDEFYEGRDWVRDNLHHDHVGAVSGFETTIRSLGGLLAAYDLSKDDVFLKKADDLGKRLVKAYETSSGLPHGSINLGSGRSNNFGWNSNAYILAEVGTQQVEYRYLARATGTTSYATKSEHVFDLLHKIQPNDGLLFQNLPENGNNPPAFSGSKVSFGAMGDSVYEYMLKVWVQGGKKEPMYREMWDRAMSGLHDQLIQKTTPNGLTFIADRENGRIKRKMDHLACFMGGALALSAYTDPKGLKSKRAQRDLKTAKALTYTCYQMYARTKTGIAPEYMQFDDRNNDMSVPGNAKFYILRPETVEAFYYLSVLTGDPIYREWGWEVFQSIEKYCRTEYGYGSLKDVNRPGSVEDRMESFFLAETLKYLYLLFDPDSEIDILKKHVFNTEAHPLSIFQD